MKKNTNEGDRLQFIDPDGSPEDRGRGVPVWVFFLFGTLIGVLISFDTYGVREFSIESSTNIYSESISGEK